MTQQTFDPDRVEKIAKFLKRYVPESLQEEAGDAIYTLLQEQIIASLERVIAAREGAMAP